MSATLPATKPACDFSQAGAVQTGGFIPADPARRYSVVCCKKDHSPRVVASGLPYSEAARLDEEYRARIEAEGKHFSSWVADLHFCKLETAH